MHIFAPLGCVWCSLWWWNVWLSVHAVFKLALLITHCCCCKQPMTMSNILHHGSFLKIYKKKKKSSICLCHRVPEDVRLRGAGYSIQILQLHTATAAKSDSLLEANHQCLNKHCTCGLGWLNIFHFGLFGGATWTSGFCTDTPNKHKHSSSTYRNNYTLKPTSHSIIWFSFNRISLLLSLLQCAYSSLVAVGNRQHPLEAPSVHHCS